VDRGDRGLHIYHRLTSCKIVRSLFTLATFGIFPFFLARQITTSEKKGICTRFECWEMI
jgi:hypothetical protein